MNKIDKLNELLGNFISLKEQEPTKYRTHKMKISDLMNKETIQKYNLLDGDVKNSVKEEIKNKLNAELKNTISKQLDILLQNQKGPRIVNESLTVEETFHLFHTLIPKYKQLIPEFRKAFNEYLNGYFREYLYAVSTEVVARYYHEEEKTGDSQSDLKTAQTDLNVARQDAQEAIDVPENEIEPEGEPENEKQSKAIDIVESFYKELEQHKSITIQRIDNYIASGKKDSKDYNKTDYYYDRFVIWAIKSLEKANPAILDIIENYDKNTFDELKNIVISAYKKEQERLMRRVSTQKLHPIISRGFGIYENALHHIFDDIKEIKDSESMWSDEEQASTPPKPETVTDIQDVLPTEVLNPPSDISDSPTSDEQEITPEEHQENEQVIEQTIDALPENIQQIVNTITEIYEHPITTIINRGQIQSKLSDVYKNFLVDVSKGNIDNIQSYYEEFISLVSNRLQQYIKNLPKRIKGYNKNIEQYEQMKNISATSSDAVTLQTIKSKLKEYLLQASLMDFIIENAKDYISQYNLTVSEDIIDQYRQRVVDIQNTIESDGSLKATQDAAKEQFEDVIQEEEKEETEEIAQEIKGEGGIEGVPSEEEQPKSESKPYVILEKDVMEDTTSEFGFKNRVKNNYKLKIESNDLDDFDVTLYKNDKQLGNTIRNTNRDVIGNTIKSKIQFPSDQLAKLNMFYKKIGAFDE
jgi:hypothetical protein